MNTQISTKLAALGIALIMNGAMISGVAFLFNGQLHGGAIPLVQTQATASRTAV
jgi:hypothetical protein